MFKKLIVAALAFTVLGAGGFAKADTFDKIKKRGKIIVGVKPDYKPWGFVDPNGKLIGLEIDLAGDVAKALGVEIELVPVQTANRMQFLQQGKVDMFIATMTDRADRREVVGTTVPNYYSSGTNAMARKSLKLKDWGDLRGKPVCTKQGSFYNKPMSEEFGIKLMAFVGNAEAKQALKDNCCLAWMYDDSSIQNNLQDPQWADFEMPFVTRDAASWGIGVPKDEQETAFGRFISGIDDVRILRSWAGVSSETPDMQAVLGESDIEGVFVAVSASKGFMTSPAVGRVMSQLLIYGNANDPVVEPLHLRRFQTGELVPEPLTNQDLSGGVGSKKH